jgi:hypothetical protein
MSKVKYNYELLKKFAEENKIELAEEYKDAKLTSKSKIKIKCKCNTIFERMLGIIIKGNKYLCNICMKNTSDCKYGGNCQKLCDNNDCVICYNNSFASTDMSKFWSNKNIKNSRQVYKFSSMNYLFICNACKHEFKISLTHVSEGKWCPYCSHQKLCDKNDCVCCFNNSFSSSEKSKFLVKI